jgi:hypothetical protein
MKTIHFTVLALAASALHSAELNHISTADPPAGSEPAQVPQLDDVSPPDVVEFVSTEFRTIETDGVQSLTVHRPRPTGLADHIGGGVLVGGNISRFNGEPANGLVRVVPGLAESTAVEFSETALSVSESAGSLSVEIRRTGNSAEAVTVEVRAIGGTATDGEDYSFPAQTVSFAPLEVIKNVSVSILDDEWLEADETCCFGKRA